MSDVTDARDSLPPLGRTATICMLVALLVGAALAAGWSASQPVSVVVDGKTYRFQAGTTVAVLEERGFFSEKEGDLLSVEGDVVVSGGGDEARVTCNGGSAKPYRRLHDGDVVVSHPGADRVEPLMTSEVAVPYPTRTEGKGPIVEITQQGQDGARRVVMGRYSQAEVTSTVVVQPIPAVFTRSGPKRGAKIVALTFDDGPVKGQTDKVLDILKEYEVPATFFVVGSQVRAEPELVRRMAAEGHLIGNHSYSHPRMTALSRGRLRREVTGARAAISDAAGVYTGWFRPPYGAGDGRMGAELRALNQRVVMWDVDPQDWRRPGTYNIVRNVIDNVDPGSVVLLHDGGAHREQTIAALPQIITHLRKQGYVFVTVGDLAAAK